jgi:hypothetical protein
VAAPRLVIVRIGERHMSHARVRLLMQEGAATEDRPYRSSTVSSASKKADVILLNGRIWTGNKFQPWAEALASSGERIIAVGSTDGSNSEG